MQKQAGRLLRSYFRLASRELAPIGFSRKCEPNPNSQANLEMGRFGPYGPSAKQKGHSFECPFRFAGELCYQSVELLNKYRAWWKSGSIFYPILLSYLPSARVYFSTGVADVNREKILLKTLIVRGNEQYFFFYLLTSVFWFLSVKHINSTCAFLTLPKGKN